MNFPADHFSTSLPLSRQWHDNVVYLYLLHCPNRACWFNVTCGRGLVECQTRTAQLQITANFFNFPSTHCFVCALIARPSGTNFHLLAHFSRIMNISWQRGIKLITQWIVFESCGADFSTRLFTWKSPTSDECKSRPGKMFDHLINANLH